MNDLILIKKESIRTVFVEEGGLEPHLAKVKEFVDQYSVLDMRDKKQRAELKTRVTYITSVKTQLKSTGDDLAKEIKKEPKLVDASRRKGQEFLSAVISDLRKPLTEWEDAEEERVNSIHKRINSMADMLDVEELEIGDSTTVKLRIDELEGIEIDDTFEEFTEYADTTKSKTLAQLCKWHDKKVTHEKEQAELEELRKAKAEQDEINRLAGLKEIAELAEKHAKAAEEQRIKAAEDQVRQDAEENLAIEKHRAEQETIRLKLQAETAERQKLEAEQATRDAEAAAERKITEAKAAHDQKIIDDRLAEEAETKRREENKAHAKKINNAAVKCLMRIGRVDKELAIEIVTAIYKKEVDNVSIKY